MMTRHLLVCFEGAGWHALSTRVDQGDLPSFSALIEHGLCGHLTACSALPVIASGVSLATGCHPARHELLAPHVADPGLGEVRPVLASDRRRAALWEVLDAAGVRTHAVGWPASHGSSPEHGVVVSNAFGHPCFSQNDAAHASMIHPPCQSGRLSELVLHPEETDAGMIAHFVPRWREIDQTSDPRLAILGRAIAQTSSVHNCVTELLENDPVPFSSVFYRFPVEFEALQMPRDGSSSEDPFGDPVDASWRFLDLLLGRLVALAGEDVFIHVVGLSSNCNKPGFLISRGPGIAQDNLIFGVRAVDLAPTILAAMGFTLEAESFDGRVLPELIPAENAGKDGENPLPPPESISIRADREPIRETHDVLRRFLQESDGLPDPQAEERWGQTQTLWDWLRARALVAAERHLEALPLLEKLAESQPERADYVAQLADSQLQLGLLAESHANAEVLVELIPGNPSGVLLRARIEAAMGRLDAATRSIELAREMKPDDPHLLLQLGFTLNRLRRWDEAIKICDRALELAPDSAEAHLGIARAMLGKRYHREAQSWSLEAIARNYSQPFAHLVLGIALLRQGRHSEALVALEIATRIQPDFELGHYYYARALRKAAGGTGRAPSSLSVGERRRRRHDQLAAMRRDAQVRETRRAHDRAMARKGTPFLARGTRQSPSVPLELNAVVGLPGSGLSLVMKMLQAAQTPLHFDVEEGLRWSALTDLRTSPGILDCTEEKIFRLPSSLLCSLPRLHYYRVLFVHRPATELAASHLLRMRRPAIRTPDLPDNLRDAQALLRQHEFETIAWLKHATNVEYLQVQFADLIGRPDEVSREIAAFFGSELVRSPEAMATVIDPSRVHARSGP